MLDRKHMNKILVDTNILVYAIDEDSKFHTISKKLIQNNNYNLFTTSKNFSEFLVVLTRGIDVTVTTEEALIIFENLMAYFTILYPNEASIIKFKELLLKYKPKGLKIHDFEIISIALQNGIKKVATKNKDDFKAIKK